GLVRDGSARNFVRLEYAGELADRHRCIDADRLGGHHVLRATIDLNLSHGAASFRLAAAGALGASGESGLLELAGETTDVIAELVPHGGARSNEVHVDVDHAAHAAEDADDALAASVVAHASDEEHSSSHVVAHWPCLAE